MLKEIGDLRDVSLGVRAEPRVRVRFRVRV